MTHVEKTYSRAGGRGAWLGHTIPGAGGDLGGVRDSWSRLWVPPMQSLEWTKWRKLRGQDRRTDGQAGCVALGFREVKGKPGAGAWSVMPSAISECHPMALGSPSMKSGFLGVPVRDRALVGGGC